MINWRLQINATIESSITESISQVKQFTIRSTTTTHSQSGLREKVASTEVRSDWSIFSWGLKIVPSAEFQLRKWSMIHGQKSR